MQMKRLKVSSSDYKYTGDSFVVVVVVVVVISICYTVTYYLFVFFFSLETGRYVCRKCQ